MPRPGAPAAAHVVARAAPVAALARIRSGRSSRFTRSARKQTGRARRAFRENGPGHKLMDALAGNAYFFSLTPRDLDPKLSDDPSGLYDADVMTALFAAVARVFRGPVYAVVEVGRGRPGRRGKLHAHVIAHRLDGPAHLDRDTQRCQWVYDPFNLYKYLAKPPEPDSLEAQLDAAAARVLSRGGRLPNTRRHLITAERLEWSRRRLLPIEPKPPHDAPKLPQTATPATPALAAPAPRPRPLRHPLSRPLPPATSTSAARAARLFKRSSYPMRQLARPGRRRRPAPQARGPPPSPSSAGQPPLDPRQ